MIFVFLVELSFFQYVEGNQVAYNSSLREQVTANLYQVKTISFENNRADM